MSQAHRLGPPASLWKGDLELAVSRLVYYHEALGGELRHEGPEPGDGAILCVGSDAGGQRGESEMLAAWQRRQRGRGFSTARSPLQNLSTYLERQQVPEARANVLQELARRLVGEDEGTIEAEAPHEPGLDTAKSAT